MFDERRSPQVAPPTAAETAADTLLLAALVGVARAENQHAYHKVNTAAEFHRRWTRRRADLPERLATAWSHAAHTEIATHLACSATTAAQYVEVGVALRERLPHTRAAFAAGDIDYTKARRIATATTGFSNPVTATVEAAAVAFADRCAPAGFATELEDLLIRTAPDEYAQLRKDAAARQRRLRRRNRGTTHRIEADLAPHEAAAVWQRVAEVAATVCAHDPRDTQHRLVDAYLALMHGEDHLACTCGRSDCTADPTPPSRRTPLVQITVDAQSLLGLRSEPAYLPGHGPIDPDLARELAAGATWQPILTELVDLAVAAGILTPEQAAAAGSPAEPDTALAPRPSPAPRPSTQRRRAPPPQRRPRTQPSAPTPRLRLPPTPRLRLPPTPRLRPPSSPAQRRLRRAPTRRSNPPCTPDCATRCSRRSPRAVPAAARATSRLAPPSRSWSPSSRPISTSGSPNCSPPAPSSPTASTPTGTAACSSRPPGH